MLNITGSLTKFIFPLILKFIIKQVTTFPSSSLLNCMIILSICVQIEGETFTFSASLHSTIQNSISPNKTNRDSKVFAFSLLYVSGDKVIPFLQQLNRASQLHHVEHQTMIAMIAHHRQSLYPFKSMFFDDLYERECGNFVVDMVEPLVNLPGRIVVSESKLYFHPFNNAFSVADILKWKLESITQVICRTYILQDVGLEIFVKDNTSVSNYLFVLDSEKSRNELNQFLLDHCKTNLEDSSPSNMTLKWQNGVISNYEYLMYVNNIADRTLNNLSQYPVYPWIFTDYTSKTIDIANSEIYRDLTKPIGALTPNRLKRILERYKDMPEPKFMFGSHYSTPGYVTYYLMRSQPDLMLCLMGGKFDHPDRVFAGIAESWNNVLENTADFKELIPQFYNGDGSFLENRMKINFGKRQNGSIVDHVALPPWASSPKDFVAKMRAGLESDYVSSNLHHWIDLIFGYKQRGEFAEKSHNVFHNLCYPGSVDLNSIVDPNEKNSVVTQILEFGQVPQQVFTKPHPERKMAAPYPTLTVINSNSNVEEEIPDKVEPGEVNMNRRLSAVGTTLDNFTLSDKVQVKDHVTFFIDCSETQSVYVGTASGMLYTYRLAAMKYAYSAIISNVSLMCAMDLGTSLCVGSSDGKCYFLSKQQGNVYLAFPAHYDTVSDVTLDRNLVFTSSWDSSVKVWDVVKGAGGRVKTLRLFSEIDHEDRVQSIGVKDAVLVSCVEPANIVIWDWDAMEVLHNLDYSHHDITQVTIWNNKIVLLGVSIVYLDIVTFGEEFSKRFDTPITSHQMLPDTNAVVLAESSGKVTLFDMVEGVAKGEFVTGQSNLTSAHYLTLFEGVLLVGNQSKYFAVYRNRDS